MSSQDSNVPVFLRPTVKIVVSTNDSEDTTVGATETTVQFQYRSTLRKLISPPGGVYLPLNPDGSLAVGRTGNGSSNATAAAFVSVGGVGSVVSPDDADTGSLPPSSATRSGSATATATPTPVRSGS